MSMYDKNHYNKKREKKNTKELYKKALNDPDNHDDVVTPLEPDILNIEVKWSLGSITKNKASGGDKIPAKLLQILNHNAVKVLHSLCQQIWKTQQWPQNWKRSVFILIPKKSSAKECSNYHTMTLISTPARFGSKSFKLGFSSTWTENFQMYKMHLEKAEEPEIKS